MSWLIGRVQYKCLSEHSKAPLPCFANLSSLSEEEEEVVKQVQREQDGANRFLWVQGPVQKGLKCAGLLSPEQGSFLAQTPPLGASVEAPPLPCPSSSGRLALRRSRGPSRPMRRLPMGAVRRMARNAAVSTSIPNFSSRASP